MFGDKSANLNAYQLSGIDSEENRDIIHIAEENGVLLGTIHATIPQNFPHLCGISAVCTTPDARGRGIGKALLDSILQTTASLGVKAHFLGTGNPVAAKLYGSFGFSFLPGSHIMAKFSEGDWNEVLHLFQKAPRNVQLIKGSEQMRIPVIPLFLNPGKSIILDCNTKIVSNHYITQTSCMGLYPRYQQLTESGGNFWGIIGDNTTLGAVASVAKTTEGNRFDLHAAEGYVAYASAMFSEIKCEYDQLYAVIADADKFKQQQIEALGFQYTGETVFSNSILQINCKKYFLA